MSTLVLHHKPPTRSPLVSQFAHPRGLLGSLVGRLMSVKNRPMNALAVEALQLRANERVLEVGFGHGWTVGQLAQRTPRGMVAGIDLSATMLEQATRRNSRYIQEGRVELTHGCACEMPFSDRVFHKVCAVNNIQFWPDMDEGLREVYRVLLPLGRLVLCLRRPPRPATRGLASGFSDGELDEVCSALGRAGFVEIHCETHELGRDVTVVYADKPYFVAAVG